MHQREAAKIVGGRIGQDQGAVVAIELDAVTGAEERCAAHLQAAAGAGRERERQRDAALGGAVGQREYAAAEAGDRAAEPLEIMKAMADEIAQDTATAVAACLPAFEPQARCLVFDVPGHDHVAQAADRAGLQQRLGAPPRGQFGKVEIDDGRAGALARGREHRARAREIGGERLLDEDGLAEIERAPRHLGLAIGRNRDGHRVDGGVIDQRRQSPSPRATFGRPRKLRRSRGVGSRQRHHLAARVAAECREQDVPPVIAADDSHADHDDLHTKPNREWPAWRTANS